MPTYDIHTIALSIFSNSNESVTTHLINVLNSHKVEKSLPRAVSVLISQITTDNQCQVPHPTSYIVLLP